MTVEQLAVEMREGFAEIRQGFTEMGFRISRVEAEVAELRRAVSHDTAGERNLDHVRRPAGGGTPAVSG